MPVHHFRTPPPSTAPHRFGEFVADPAQRQLLRNGTALHLSPKAFQLLLILLECAPRAMSKRELQEQIWPDTFVSEASLANLISELRRALGAGDESRIRTVHGYGYAFDRESPAGAPRRARSYRAAATLGGIAMIAVTIAVVWIFLRRGHTAPPVSSSALEEYLTVRSSLSGIERGGSKMRAGALARLDSILRREPDFARALATRAYVESAINFWEPSTRWYSAAMADADRALALDPNLIEPHLARAYVMYSPAGGWKIFDAVSELRLAAAMSPAHDVTHQRLARMYRHLGWFDELAREADAVERLNPQAPELARLRGLRLLDSGRCRDALVEFAKARPIASDPFPLWQQIATAQLYCGDVDTARQRLETEYRRSPSDTADRPLTAALLAVARLRAGEHATDELEKEALSIDQRIGHFHHVLISLAEVRALRGDQTRAVAYLTRAADEGMPCVPCFENDPLLASLRSDPRFQALLSELRRREAPMRHP